VQGARTTKKHATQEETAMTDQANGAVTNGAHHIGLTVPDLARTRSFFIDTLGYDQVGEVPDYPAVFVSDGTIWITIWQARDPANATPFDRKNNIGLHHLALLVDNHAALDSLHERLQQTADVEIEFAPESLGGGEVRHMMTYVPGGIRVEFLSPSA
jgi:catechol 2,3-dioxygenase-like lactoylglutathione lyase family enzyme